MNNVSYETFLRLPEEKKENVIRQGLLEFSLKNYQDANTDLICKACGISKGSLYHYFGNKRNFYLFLLSYSIRTFESVRKNSCGEGEGFYDVLFCDLNSKLNMYRTHPNEVALLTMAAKEQCGEVFKEKNELLKSSMQHIRSADEALLKAAFSRVALREGIDPALALDALNLYLEALRMRYMERYRNKPYAFYENREKIKEELRRYLDLFLNGVARR